MIRMSSIPADPDRRLERVGRREPAAASPAEATSKPQSAPQPAAKDDPSAAKLLCALVLGLGFGFLLQKGGVAKFDILIGVLLLENFVVVKVMLSAIILGMVGVYLLQRAKVIEPHIKDTVYGANILGGLIFGAGFGLLAYCPGTDAAALGQGNLDALVGIAGMIVGSYLYALHSRTIGRTIGQWGRRGKLTIHEAIGVPQGIVVVAGARPADRRSGADREAHRPLTGHADGWPTLCRTRQRVGSRWSAGYPSLPGGNGTTEGTDGRRRARSGLV
jgi:hypothetical protein